MILSKQSKHDATITSIVFATGQRDTSFVFAGNYLCWREPEGSFVYVLNILPILRASDQDALRVLDLS